MKLTQLKHEALGSWETLNLIDGAAISSGQYHHEMRQYGDLRRKSTWETICINLEAKWLIHGLENQDIVRYFQNPTTLIGQAFNSQVLDAVLGYSTALEQIKNGLERLYLNPISAGDRSIAVDFFKRIAKYETSSWILDEAPSEKNPLLAA